MSLILGKQLSNALSEIKKQTSSDLKTAKWSTISETSKLSIKNAHADMKNCLKKICETLDIEGKGLRLNMGMYQSSGYAYPHVWGAIIPMEVGRASHDTPQMYIFRNEKALVWGICLSSSAKSHPAFGKVYEAWKASLGSVIDTYKAEDLYGEKRLYDEGDEEKNAFRRIVDTSNTAESFDWMTLAQSDFQKLLPHYLELVEKCRASKLFAKEGNTEESWRSAWIEYFEGPLPAGAGYTVPDYLKSEIGGDWESFREIWEIGMRESLLSLKEPAESRIHALLYGPLRRTGLSGNWRGPLKDNFQKVTSIVSGYVDRNPEGISNDQFLELIEKVKTITGFELKSYITRLLCDLNPNIYLPVSEFTFETLIKVSEFFQVKTTLPGKKDYIGQCKLAQSLAAMFASKPEEKNLYIFDHFLHWVNSGNLESGKSNNLVPKKSVEVDPVDASSKRTQRFWKISCGQGGSFSGAHRSQGVISIGWSETDNLINYKNKDDIQAFLRTIKKEDSSDEGHVARTCWAFYDSIKVGDTVFGYGSGTILLIGKVVGPYEYRPVSEWTEGKFPKVHSSHMHTRKIEWVNSRAIETSELSAELRSKLETNKTLFELSQTEADEILQLATLSTSENENYYEERETAPTKDQLVQKTGKSIEFFNALERRLLSKKQIVFFGPPGTSKTHIAKLFINYFLGDKGGMQFVQFHPSYSYEDFIEGYRPNGTGFSIRPGAFKEFCKKAKSDPDQKYVFFIDEMNRGNLPQIFGELLYLLEYRDEEVALPYSKSHFSIPANIYIV
jgi:hypothetical protein